MNKDKLDSIIEQSFRSEPDFHLPADFARKVAIQVARREQWKSDLLDYLYLSGITVAVIVVALGAFFVFDKPSVLRMLSFVVNYSVPLGIVVFILNFIFFTDRVILPVVFARWSKT